MHESPNKYICEIGEEEKGKSVSEHALVRGEKKKSMNG